MDTLKELVEYCEELNPVGAILLAGEWGCGKTYFIENRLKKELEGKAVIVRISLFGMESIEELHTAVKEAWIKANFNHQKVFEIIDKIDSANVNSDELVEFLPKPIAKPIKKLNKVAWDAFIDIKNTIDDKKVILAFDDLERCNIDLIDVLGTINDYCENKQFHTIIIANEDALSDRQVDSRCEADVCLAGDKDDSGKSKEFNGKITFRSTNSEISYSNIKEKIIRKTIKYEPDYSTIVSEILNEFKHQDGQYCKFIKGCKSGLTTLFSFEYRNEEGGGNDKMAARPLVEDNNEKESRIKPQHNIRSLKCAINDFHRLYVELEKNNIENLDQWLYSYVSYVIACKMGMGEIGKYGTLFADQKIYETFPMCNHRYWLDAEKEWIIEGRWDEQRIGHEIKLVIKRDRAMTPAEIVKSHRVADVDDDDLIKGFPEVLEMAYSGELTLDEYVIFIENSSWSREYDLNHNFENIDWKMIQKGIKRCIEKMTITGSSEPFNVRHIIQENNKEYFEKDEWDAYKMIADCMNSEPWLHAQKKRDYINGIKNNPSRFLLQYDEKTLDIFDEEMAIATARSFEKSSNAEKLSFSKEFITLWKLQCTLYNADFNHIRDGLNKLVELLESQYQSLMKSEKRIAALHTKNLSDRIREILSAYDEK